MKRTAIAAGAVMLLVACEADTRDRAADEMAADTTPIVESGAAERATAMLRDSAGRELGTVTLVAAADSGVRITAEVRGIAPGEHGIHVHQVGQCDAASAFESAGDHLNPTGAQHGLENPAGPHLGDMPNLMVGADSTGTLSFASSTLTVGTGGNLLDGDGAAVVVHAGPDDQRTDPSGESGDRIACGVIQGG